ncbi:Nn.00g095310.m01.CDS01 [Neocucurbitaria sp. VM-36]
MRSTIFTLTAGLAATASAFDCHGNYFSFFNRDGGALSYQRLDPALSPGAQSPHLHSFDGGNALAASTSFEQTQTSTCTTARIKPDKSLYWRPTLFWNGNGTGFYRVPEKATKIYYKYGDGDKWANVTGFPEDFNMIAGNPFKRSDGPNPAGVRWACHQPNGGGDAIFSNGFPTGFTSCNYGFASEVTFPSCWNGQKLDHKNPNAHMAYPSGSGGVGIENCPTTHRAARFPTVFIEFWWDVSSFDGKYGANDTPWVISNGDPSGYGFHADFLNGWEKGVLEKATAETGGCNCGCGCGQKEMEECFGAENVNSNDDADFKTCAATSSYGDDDAAPVFETLPGCNPLQSGPADATVVTGPNCAATAAPAPGGDKTSSSTPKATKTPADAASSPAITTSDKVSPTSEADAYSSAVVKDDTDAKPSLTLSLPNKQDEPAPTSSKDEVKPSSTVATPKDDAKPTSSPTATHDAPTSGDLPSLSLTSTAKPADYTGSPSTGSPTGDEEECKAPVYVTVTPTVYVTASSDSTSCGLGTIYQTVTQIATVTVSV